MAVMTHYEQSIVVVRAGRSSGDRYGNDDLFDWSEGAVVRTTYDRVSVQPATSTEQDTANRNTLTSGWHVRSKPGTDVDVTAYDRVEWAGRVCEVQGDVQRWPHPIRRGAVHHVEFLIDLRAG